MFRRKVLIAALALACTPSVVVDKEKPTLLADGRSIGLRTEAIDPPAGPGVGFRLEASSTTPERRFITARPREGEAYPAMLVGPSAEQPGWHKVTLWDSATPGFGWEFIGPVGQSEALFGVLDSGVGIPSYQLVIVGSPDWGATWFERGRLRKPDAQARVERVTMDIFGNGRLSLRLDWSEDLEAPVGRYHFDTKDGGKTFAPAIFEPTASP